jgi:hypothetical protein
LVSQRSQNNTFAGGALKADDRESEMSAFDALPPAIRWSLNECASKLTAVNTWHHRMWARERGLPVEVTIDKLAMLEGFEIEVFAGQYLAQMADRGCGHAGEPPLPLPHVAAGASIQRYGPVGPSLHPPRRYGKPVMRASRKRRRW